MVQVLEVVERTSSTGNTFRVVIVGSDAQVVFSKEGKPRVDAVKAGIPSNLPIEALQALIGSKLPGKIEKQECEPYTFIGSDGEEITLDYRWQYVAE